MEAIRSPIVWAGSKNRYADIIMKNLPKDFDTVLDLFCGSGEVGIGMLEGKKVTCNDFGHQLMGMHSMFQDSCKNPEKFVKEMIELERYYGLGKPKTKKQEGYQLHNEALKSNYLSLRQEYDNIRLADMLYILHCNSFSNGIRFSSKGNMSQPYGQRYLNPSLQKKMLQWLRKLQDTDVMFTCEDFRKVGLEGFDFVYVDSPYLLTDSPYQETKRTGWGLKEEYALYRKLDKYEGKWMLSNQLYSKGKENYILKEWIDSRDDLRIECLNSDSYKNCNYQREQGMTVELLIMNY